MRVEEVGADDLSVRIPEGWLFLVEKPERREGSEGGFRLFLSFCSDWPLNATSTMKFRLLDTRLRNPSSRQSLLWFIYVDLDFSPNGLESSLSGRATLGVIKSR